MSEQYLEMMLTGSKNRIENMRANARAYRKQAEIAVERADVVEREAMELEKLRDAWISAVKGQYPDLAKNL